MLRDSFVILIMTLVIMSCKRTDVPKATGTADSSFLIKMEKTGCYGTCPAYLLVISDTGEMRFRGYGHTRVDSASSRLTPEEIDILKTLISDREFLVLKEEYIADVSDLPFTHLTILTEGREKKISCRGRMPDAFQTVESFLTKKVDSKGWIKGTDHTPKGVRELIIDVDSSVSLQDILQQFETFEMQLVKKLSPGQNLYLVSCQVAEEDADEMLQVLKSTQGVKAAQWNHTLKKRDQ